MSRDETAALPRSEHRKRPGWLSPLWLVPVMAAGLASWLIHRKVALQGPNVRIKFHDVSGLQVGKSEVFYRGAKVGDVLDLTVTEDRAHVLADVQFLNSAKELAREGSRFWIVRPKVSLGAVTGLSTLVTGAYIEMSPGRGQPAETFVGVESPPVETEGRRQFAFILTAQQLNSLEEGAPVFFRGFKVGNVGESRLSDDSRLVRMRILIDESYRPLVRANSRFWNAGGINMHFGLFHGMDLTAKSADTLVTGGVAFATPDAPGAQAAEGQVFPLEDKAQEQWLKWSPGIALRAQHPPSKSAQTTSKIRAGSTGSK